MKITRAMYMMSSMKLRKAKSKLEETLPFFEGTQKAFSGKSGGFLSMLGGKVDFSVNVNATKFTDKIPSGQKYLSDFIAWLIDKKDNISSGKKFLNNFTAILTEKQDKIKSKFINSIMDGRPLELTGHLMLQQGLKSYPQQVASSETVSELAFHNSQVVALFTEPPSSPGNEAQKWSDTSVVARKSLMPLSLPQQCSAQQ